MLKRKIESQLEDYFSSSTNQLLIVDGARQIGKSYIIRTVGQRMFANYIEINMEEDRQHDRLFAEARTVESFYLALSSIAGERMKKRADTLVFIDEIQAYEHLLTLVKFLIQDNRFTYIASGSLLGVSLRKTQSIPVGSIRITHMYPLDFEEYLWANGVGTQVIDEMRSSFEQRNTLPLPIHNKIMDYFRRYLLTGGLPDVVNIYLREHNIDSVRKRQDAIRELYGADAAKYEQESSRKLKIQRIYEMIPSNMENRKKRVVVKDIEEKTGKRTSDYQEEFDYLVSSGIALEVDAISKPTYPLCQNAGKNLLKLYLCDVGLFSCILYRNNIRPILDDIRSINLGAVYETVVAQELKAHGFGLYYFDNKKTGEVDYLIDDTAHLAALPIEVKSGRDYKIHSALDRFLSISEYNIHQAFVLSNEPSIYEENGITYLPIYFMMFLSPDIKPTPEDLYF